MSNIHIYCKPSLLETVQRLNLTYEDNPTELDVIIPFTDEVLNINNKYSDDAEFVSHFGLDYDQGNCIELY